MISRWILAFRFKNSTFFLAWISRFSWNIFCSVDQVFLIRFQFQVYQIRFRHGFNYFSLFSNTPSPGFFYIAKFKIFFFLLLLRDEWQVLKRPFSPQICPMFSFHSWISWPSSAWYLVVSCVCVFAQANCSKYGGGDPIKMTWYWSRALLLLLPWVMQKREKRRKLNDVYSSKKLRTTGFSYSKVKPALGWHLREYTR